MTLFKDRIAAETLYMRTTMPFPYRLPSAAVVAVVAVALLGVAAPAPTQSLADVARAEGQRRKEQPKAGKAYTNDNLRQDFTASAPSPDPAALPATTPSDAATPDPSTPDPPATNEPKKDEAYWKERLRSAREQLERTQAFASALESQINGLTADFINRDDPAQRSAIESNRKKAVAEHERVLREAETHKKAIAAVEEDARKAGVPPGWLR